MRKKVFAMMLAAMMIGTTFMGALTVMADPDPADPSTPTPANSTTAPYEKVKPTVSADGLGDGVKEYVEVDKPGARNPKLKYTLTLGDIKVFSVGEGENKVTYGDLSKVNASGINGKQLGTVEFDAGEVVGFGNKTKAYTIPEAMITAINALEFDRPGIYFWELTKTVDDPDTSDSYVYPNDTQRAALLIRVDEDGSKLHAPVVSMASIDTTTGMPTGDKNIRYQDVFPDAPGQLTVENEVSGNQGSKDQYMKYTVTLTGLDEYAGTQITPDGANSVNGATPKYGEGFESNTTSNLTPQTIGDDGKVTFEVWLKDGEMIEFPNIPPAANVKFSVEEHNNTHTGYNVTNEVNDTPGTGDKVTDVPLDPNGSRVEFKNEKQTAPPTGIIMAVAPATAFIAIGGIGAGIVFAGKRRREDDEEEA